MRFIKCSASAATVFAIGASIAAASVAGAQTDSSFNRTEAPTPTAPKPLTFPHAQTRKLANGVPIVILEDHTSPVVSVVAVLDVPARLEPAGKTGLSATLTSMLSEGTTTRTADQLADAFAEIGNRVSPTRFYTITGNVDRSLELMADELRHPSFPQAALDRVKANQIAQLRRAQENPTYLGIRAFGNVVYGADHPYARMATESEVASITRGDITAYYNEYYRPPNVSFVVAGDITPAQAVAKLSRVFGDWPAGGKAATPVSLPNRVAPETIYLVDRPGSPQSVIVAGALGPRRDSPDYFATDLANTSFGGAFTSRVNLNLREDKHYSYGANSFFSYRRVPEPSTFMVYTSVSTPKTDSSLVQLAKEFADIRATRPITPAELAFAKSSATKGLPLQFETIGARADAIAGLVRQGLPLDYYNTVVQRFTAVPQAAVQQSAVRYLDPAKMAIVVVGDRKVIEPGIRAANIAPVVIVDENGNPVK
ncbi:MAG: M16 family metallopeptidase [Gemmatimonadaceae bacterium]